MGQPHGRGPALVALAAPIPRYRPPESVMRRRFFSAGQVAVLQAGSDSGMGNNLQRIQRIADLFPGLYPIICRDAMRRCDARWAGSSPKLLRNMGFLMPRETA